MVNKAKLTQDALERLEDSAVDAIQDTSMFDLLRSFVR
jgi:hypothetical protein